MADAILCKITGFVDMLRAINDAEYMQVDVIDFQFDGLGGCGIIKHRLHEFRRNYFVTFGS